MGQTWNISDNSTSGNNVSATLSGSTLTISGTGNMADFDVSVEGEAPWYSVRTNIQTVTIQNGVTNIGNRAFKDCSNLRTITALPVSVTKIGYQSFYNCTHSNFTAITIPATVNTIEGEAFLNCTNLKTVTLENGSGTLNFARYRIGTTGSNYRYGWFLGSPVQTLNLGRNYTYETTNPIIDIQATLQTLTIKITVTSIGVDAFSNCSLLKTVTFEDGSATLNFSKSAGVSTENYFANTPIETLYLG
ncbi:MAG: leucine-rich repeat domain-containing protein, partial [Candidatus Symbiothrix sp.]|nr:leucine-rich repeat domain-containing protein [Candidatus Symbiothrix sp.]